jgi:hypothetical protein
MSKLSRALLNSVICAVGGVAVVVITAVLTGALAMVTQATSSVPGIFTATGGRTNGLASLDFQPHALGMLLVVLGFAAAGALLGWHRPTRGPAPRPGNPGASAS